MKKLLVMIVAFATAQLGLTLAAGAQAVPAAPDPALAAVFAGASSLPQADLMPKPTLKCGNKCYGNIVHTSPTISGSGSSCTNATNSLNSQLADIAVNDCVDVRLWDGVCNIVDHDTTACTLIGSGTYQIKGYATYACSISTC